MKKILSLAALLLGILSIASAAPARPGTFKYTQPDGTVIVLERHGDEYMHWTTNQAGVIVEKGADGFYRPASGSPKPSRLATASKRQPGRRAYFYDTPPETNFGDRKILAILINFSDSTFVLNSPRQRFDNMLNQQGYSDNGAYGSVRDYYVENSMNQYRPSFDVYGPVTLSHSSGYYDNRGGSVQEALIEACQLLDGDVDFSQYDTDKDGYIDMILLYYAGHNEAEGGSEESIWPHQSSGYGTFDGVNIHKYFCTSELRGGYGQEMCGIGTTCHEFAHSLGLPDMYDTDYEKNGQAAFTTSSYDIMASGNYNDNGRCPPYFNAVERNILGWMDEPELIESSGPIVLPSVRQNVAYRSETKTVGEYFVYECRDNYGWDSAIPNWGMLVYQVDKSDRIIGQGYTANYLWNETNSINAYGDHPCFRLVSPSGTYDSQPYLWEKLRSLPFPGTGNATVYHPSDWDGKQTGLTLNNIAFDGSQSSFNASIPAVRWVMGRVTDAYDNPVAGAQVVLSKAAYQFASAPALLPDDEVTTTDVNGEYEFTISVSSSQQRIVTVRKDGYVQVSENVLVSEKYNHLDVTLFEPGGTGPLSVINKYDSGQSMYYARLGNGTTSGAGCVYTADEIASMGLAGQQLTSIRFVGGATVYNKCYVFANIGTERIFIKEVNNYTPQHLVDVNVSEFGMVIPEGKDVYFGFGFTGLNTSEFHFGVTGPMPSSDGGNIRFLDFLNSTDWSFASFDIGYLNFMVSASLMATVSESLAAYGFSYIKIQDNQVPTVIPAGDKTVKSEAWYLNGASVSAPSAITSLPAGSYTYKVLLTFYDGTTEEVFYDFQVE